MMYDIITIL